MCSIHINAGNTVLDGVLYDNPTAKEFLNMLGSLAYWDDGPSVAIIYKESRTETVGPVVPIGRITSDVSLFEEYEGGITIEIAEE